MTKKKWITSTWSTNRGAAPGAKSDVCALLLLLLPHKNHAHLSVGKEALNHLGDIIQRATWAIPLNEVNFYIKEVRASPDCMKLYLLWDADDGTHDHVEEALQARYSGECRGTHWYNTDGDW